MPSTVANSLTLESLSSFFPLTFPVPNPVTHPYLVSTADLHREEDLLRNPTSFHGWWVAITTTRDTFTTLRKKQSRNDIPANVGALLGPLATPLARTYLQRLTYLYESSLSNFPTSFKMWKSYLQMRMSFVLGPQIIKKRAGGRKKFEEMKDALEEEKGGYMEEWEGGLNGIVGLEEWKSLAATFERALMHLHNLPRLWLMYLSIFNHPHCPPLLSHTHARRTYDRALRTLTPSLHARIWTRYLIFAERTQGDALAHVYRRYLRVDPSLTEHFAGLLLDATPGAAPRPLEAAKLLLSRARAAARGEHISQEGKSAYQLLADFLDVVERFPEEVGLDVDEEGAAANGREPAATTQSPETASAQGTAGPPKDVREGDGKAGESQPYDEDEDPLSPRKLDIEKIVRQDGLRVYTDQAGRLWTGLAAYWTRRGEFDRAKATFEAGIASVLTIKDFTQIFDAYAEFCEELLSVLMKQLDERGDEDEEDEDEDEAELEEMLDVKMKEFEELMDRRPFLVNDVLLRRNPNDVQEWEKRIALWGQDDVKVAETYTKSIETIQPKRATANLHRIFINFARFYEEGGTAGQSQPDIDSARKIFERGTKVNFKAVEDLAEIWCEWAEMEIRHENYDEAIRVMHRATAIPKNTKVNYHDHSLSVQARLFKSLKLWSFYVDLEESIGTVESTKQVYDKILELRIANAQIIVNYAAFLEENEYFEDSFRVYERGVELFTFPISFEIWNIYLSKFIKRYGGTKIERARDLFDQALEKCPSESCKPIFLMYAVMEEEHGLAKRAMQIYDRATQAVADEDKFEIYTIYIAKAAELYGLPATRAIYERALDSETARLPDAATAELCLRFAALERKLGEIDRARAVFAHASQFCDPRMHPRFWAEWNAFEIATGSEDTFREMLRIKRSVQAQFNTETSYLAAQANAATKGQAIVQPTAEAQLEPMAAAEKAGGARGPAFVAAKRTEGPRGEDDEVVPMEESELQANADEIHISDDDKDF